MYVTNKYYTILYKELDHRGFWYLQGSWSKFPIDANGWLYTELLGNGIC